MAGDPRDTTMLLLHAMMVMAFVFMVAILVNDLLDAHRSRLREIGV